MDDNFKVKHPDSGKRVILRCRDDHKPLTIAVTVALSGAFGGLTYFTF